MEIITMTKEPLGSMDRGQLQTEALIIESLLNAAMAIAGGVDREDAVTLVEMAHDRAHNLQCALDSIHLRASA